MSFPHDTTTESPDPSLRPHDAGLEGFEFDYESESLETLADDGERFGALDEDGETLAALDDDEGGILDDEDEEEDDEDEDDEDEEDAFFRMGEDDGLDFDEEDA